MPRSQDFVLIVFGVLFICTGKEKVLSQTTVPAAIVDNAKPLSKLPDIVAFLYTRRNPEVPQVIKLFDGESLQASNFDPSRPTKIIVHGFLSSQKRGTGGSRLREGYSGTGILQFNVGSEPPGVARTSHSKKPLPPPGLESKRSSLPYKCVLVVGRISRIFPLFEGGDLAVEDVAPSPQPKCSPSQQTKLYLYEDKSLLLMMDANVLQVDWSGMGSPSYVAARLGIPRVGKRVSRLLQMLVTVGNANFSDMHIIGHSLGAHVAGIAARTAGMGSSRQGRVTGLDPAGPGFWSRVDGRLAPSDAGMVDVVHTCGGLLGLQTPLGQVDFYPNGGSFAQPGCGADVGGGCSHCLAYEFMRMAILEPSKYYGTKCSSWNSYKRGECNKAEKVPMGMSLQPGTTGMFFLEMHGWSPVAPKNAFAPENPLWRAGRQFISSVLSPAQIVFSGGRGTVAADGGVSASC